GELGAPEPARRLPSVVVAAVAMRTEPRRVEPRLVTVREHRVDRAVRGARRGESDVLGQGDRVEEPLAALVLTSGARAVVAQPDRVERAAVTVRPVDPERAALDFDGADDG